MKTFEQLTAELKTENERVIKYYVIQLRKNRNVQNDYIPYRLKFPRPKVTKFLSCRKTSKNIDSSSTEAFSILLCKNFLHQ